MCVKRVLPSVCWQMICYNVNMAYCSFTVTVLAGTRNITCRRTCM